MCANFAQVTSHGAISGKTRVQQVVGYNLEVVIAVGYRVHSLRGVEFRRWATKVLKEYILNGYAINRKRLAQLGQAVEVMKRVSNNLDTEQVLDVVKSYSAALDLLDGYDHQTIGKPSTKARYLFFLKRNKRQCCKFYDGTLVGRTLRVRRNRNKAQIRCVSIAARLESAPYRYKGNILAYKE